MKSDRTELRQLTFSPMRVNGLAWSPAGRQIAFNAWTSAYRYKNYLVATVGSEEPKELLPEHREMEGIASWSPNANRIAFGDVPEEFGHGSRNNVIHVLDLNTKKLGTLAGSEGFWSARWSPDGRYIAAIKDDDRDPHLQRLFLYDTDSGKWLPLAADHVNNPTWSHDGKYIYYDGEGGYEGIFRVRVPNGSAEPVAGLNNIERWNMAWSGLAPDGSPLILGDAGPGEIYAMDVDWP